MFALESSMRTAMYVCVCGGVGGVGVCVWVCVCVRYLAMPVYFLLYVYAPLIWDVV